MPLSPEAPRSPGSPGSPWERDRGSTWTHKSLHTHSVCSLSLIATFWPGAPLSPGSPGSPRSALGPGRPTKPSFPTTPFWPWNTQESVCEWTGPVWSGERCHPGTRINRHPDEPPELNISHTWEEILDIKSLLRLRNTQHVKLAKLVLFSSFKISLMSSQLSAFQKNKQTRRCWNSWWEF